MPKRLTTVVVLIVTLSCVAFSQWTYIRSYSPFKSPLKPDNLWGLHGMVVDPAGKIWVIPYDATDTTTLGSTSTLKRREIFVFNPNGTAAAFSPIKTITVGGVTDSLNNDNSGRGLSRDAAGNIYYASFNRIFKIDYKTGAGLAKIDPAHTGSIAAPAIDSSGNVYVTRVVGGGTHPMKIYGSDMAFVGNALDSTTGSITRTLLVNGAGTRIYLPNIYGSTTTNRVLVYENTNGPGFGNYVAVDTLFQGFQSESMAWQYRAGQPPRLWASAGSTENPPDPAQGVSGNTWYAIQPPAKAYVDSIRWDYTFPGNPTFDDTVKNAQRPRPRAIYFTASGDTAYVACFLADSNSVKMFIRSAVVKVESPELGTPEGYELTQNYPNPFNPSTEIRFTVAKSGLTTLRVYDMLGREVQTLVNTDMTPGTYKATFHATDLPSGTYFYELVSGDARITKKMVLMK